VGRDGERLVGKALLEAMMAEEGVTPLRGRGRAARGGAGRRSGAARAGPATGGTAPRGAPAPQGAPAPRDGPSLHSAPSFAALGERVEGLTARLADTASRLAESEAALAASEAALAACEAKLVASDAARDALDAERRSLHRRLSSEPVQPAAGASLAALLRDRGLREGELEEALLGLLAERGVGLAEALTVAAAAPVQRLLAEAIVLRCAAGGCAAPAGAVSLTVAPERCEVCGGSDIARAFSAFADACRAGGLSRVVIVGGSPSYRKQLQALYEPIRHDFSLALISGTSRKSERRVRGAARSSDLVILWASTLLAHATSNAYEAANARTLTVPHRGIGSMLRFVADSLTP